MGILTRADVIAVEGLCESYSDLLAARDSLKQDIVHGTVIVAKGGSLTYTTTGKSGIMVRNRPEVALIGDADRRVSMWLAKFGLTPADRSRVSANVDPGAADPFADFA
jgi:P27 family predicted phage terminase small subunit